MCSPIVVVDILRERESQLERDSEQRVEREREREGGEIKEMWGKREETLRGEER